MADAARLFREPALARYGTPAARGTYVLATIHREANVVEARLRAILEGLARLEMHVVFPAHPRTRAAIDELGLRLAPTIELRPPFGYLEFTAALAGATVVVTDSGGVQKEAYWLTFPASLPVRRPSGSTRCSQGRTLW